MLLATYNPIPNPIPIPLAPVFISPFTRATSCQALGTSETDSLVPSIRAQVAQAPSMSTALIFVGGFESLARIASCFAN